MGIGRLAMAGLLSALLGAGAGVLTRPASVPLQADEPGEAPPETLDAVLETARRALLDDEPTKAVAVLEAAVKDWPEDRALWLALARSRTRLPGGAAAAFEAFERAIALGDAHTVGDGPGGNDAEDLFQAATAASRAGLDERAVELYREAEVVEPADPRYPLYAAQVLRRLGRADEARAALFRATQLDEHLSIAWGTLAEMAMVENRPGVALQYVARAREQQPLVTAWRVIEARAHNRKGEPTAALAVLEGVNESERLSLPVVRLWATSWAMVGEPERGAARFAEVAGQRPTDAVVTLEAATWAERAGDVGSALRLARHASMLGSEEARAMVARLEGDR